MSNARIPQKCVYYRRINPPDMRQRFLPLHIHCPAALRLRAAGLQYAGLTDATPGFLMDRLPHFHYLVFTLAGRGEMRIRDCDFELTPGSVLLAPAATGQCYRQKGDENWLFLWFHFLQLPHWFTGTDELPVWRESGGGEALEAASDGFIREVIIDARIQIRESHFPLQEFGRDRRHLPTPETPEFHAGGQAGELALLYAEIICRQLERELRQLLPQRSTFAADDRLDLVWEEVNSRLTQPWNLRTLAAKANMSVPTFIRHTRDRYRLTPMQMISQLRLNWAAQLLRATRQPVVEIGREVGYDCHPAFYTAFRRQYHCSPAEYRRQADDY